MPRDQAAVVAVPSNFVDCDVWKSNSTRTKEILISWKNGEENFYFKKTIVSSFHIPLLLAVSPGFPSLCPRFFSIWCAANKIYYVRRERRYSERESRFRSGRSRRGEIGREKVRKRGKCCKSPPRNYGQEEEVEEVEKRIYPTYVPKNGRLFMLRNCIKWRVQFFGQSLLFTVLHFFQKNQSIIFYVVFISPTIW